MSTRGQHRKEARASQDKSGGPGEPSVVAPPTLGVIASKNTTNKAAELCVTLLALYLVLELEDIPNGCAPETEAACLRTYLDTGGIPDPEIVLKDCGALRQTCDESFISPLASELESDGFNASSSPFARVNESYGQLVQLCQCVVGSETVVCSFTASRTVFLLLGIFAIFLFEVSKDSFVKVRMIVFGYVTLYFLLCLVVFSRDACDSEDFEDKREIILFLCVVSIVALFMALILELLALRGKVDLCLQRTADPEALHINKTLIKSMNAFKALGKKKANTTDSDSDSDSDEEGDSDGGDAKQANGMANGDAEADPSTPAGLDAVRRSLRGWPQPGAGENGHSRSPSNRHSRHHHHRHHRRHDRHSRRSDRLDRGYDYAANDSHNHDALTAV